MKRLLPIYFQAYHQYGEVFRFWRYNWSEFVIVQIEFEYDPAQPAFELHLGLLGIKATVTIFMPWKTKQSAQLKSALDEFLQSEQMGEKQPCPNQRTQTR